MADENKDAPESLGDIFSSGDTTSKSSDTTEKTPDAEAASTDSNKDESSSLKDDAASEKKPLPVDDKSDEAKDDSTPSQDEKSPEEKAAAEKLAADKAKLTPEAEKAKALADENTKSVETLKQRFEETQKWGQGLNQQNQQMRQLIDQQAQQLAILQKKVEGTWTDDDEASLHKGESTQEVATRAVQVGKALASKSAAVRELGPEAVNNGLTEYASLFGQSEDMRRIIVNDESPVHAALHMVDRYHFEKKYGTTPKQWIETISKEAVAAREKELRKEILEEIRGNKKKAADTPESLANKGSGDHSDSSKLKEESRPSLDSIFS